MTRRGRTRVSWAALIVIAIAMLAGTASVAIGRHVAVLRAEGQVASAAAESVTVVDSAIREQLIAAESVASTGGQGEGAGGDVPAGVGTATTRTLARDSGHPVLDDTAGGRVVVALYDTAAAPGTVARRRAQVVGYRAVPLDLAPTLIGLKPAEGGISVGGPDRTVISLPSRPARSAASETTTLGPDLPDGWSVTVWTTSAPTPAAAWLIAFVLLAAGITGAGSLAVRQTASRHRSDELRGIEQTSAAVATLATLAQQSLDLGEALPAVTTELATSLGLRGISVAAPTALGERPIFIWGVPPAEGIPLHGLEELPAGQTLVQVLSRGGRVVARLRVTAGRDLDRHEVRTLVAAGDVLTSALSNSEAFSQQLELVKRMQAVDELKTVFLATASHELRTPVAAISGFAGLLHESWDQLTPEQSRDYAERVDTIAQRLSGLVEDMLDFSRLQNVNGQGVVNSVLDLGETISAVLEEQPELAANHELVFDPVRGPHVNGSWRAVERVLVNLVGNAAKYSDGGSKIRVRVREAGDRVELVVDDEGPGIPADERGRVFSPFYRGHGDVVLRTRGAGLGLAVVAEFAASMDGLVSVDEAESGGASFVVSYPITPSDLEPNAGDVHAEV